jgi:hypothetical protein
MILSNAVSRSVVTTPYSANHCIAPFSGPLQHSFGFHKYTVIPVFQTVSNWVEINHAQTNYAQGGTWEAIEAGQNGFYEGLGYF